MATMTSKLKFPPNKGLKGILEAFSEQGTEGTVWSVHDAADIKPNGQRTYEGLNCLENGDFIRVFNDAARKELIWQGEIKLKYPPATHYNRGIQEGVDEDKWTRMFYHEKPAILYKKEVYAEIRAKAEKKAQARAAKISRIVQSCHDGVDVKLMKPLRLKPRR